MLRSGSKLPRVGATRKGGKKTAVGEILNVCRKSNECPALAALRHIYYSELSAVTEFFIVVFSRVIWEVQ
jgi:hypothetical protein